MRPNINATATAASFVDTQRRRRGHMFLPPVVVRRDTPELGATEGTPFDGKTLHAHYFVNGWDWYVAEADWNTGECFGYVTGEFPEWGYFNLRQLETIGGRMWIVERDMHYTPRLFGAPSDLPLTVYGQPVR